MRSSISISLLVISRRPGVQPLRMGAADRAAAARVAAAPAGRRRLWGRRCRWRWRWWLRRGGWWRRRGPGRGGVVAAGGAGGGGAVLAQAAVGAVATAPGRGACGGGACTGGGGGARHRRRRGGVERSLRRDFGRRCAAAGGVYAGSARTCGAGRQPLRGQLPDLARWRWLWRRGPRRRRHGDGRRRSCRAPWRRGVGFDWRLVDAPV